MSTKHDVDAHDNMNKYYIFKSEGGYRVAMGIYLGNPVIATCPWFATIGEAELFVENTKAKEEAYRASVEASMKSHGAM